MPNQTLTPVVQNAYGPFSGQGNLYQKNLPYGAQVQKVSTQANQDSWRAAERASYSNVQPGAAPAQPEPAQVVITDINNNVVNRDDHRVRLRVPPMYFFNSSPPGGRSSGGYNRIVSGYDNIFGSSNSILFPATPTINIESKAEYQSQAPVHSNQNFYFYKSSSVGAITITAKWPVMNESDAYNWLSAVHVFRAITKMKFGGTSGDMDSGSPPPVCRLTAYGNYVLDNVPVVVNNFRMDLPETVDYYRVGAAGPNNTTFAGSAMVPALTTFTLTLLPVYSRNETLGSSVKGWLDGTQRIKGLL